MAVVVNINTLHPTKNFKIEGVIMVRTKDSKNSFGIKKHNPSCQKHASPTQAPPTQLPFTWCGFCRTLAVRQEDQNSI